MPGPTSRPSLCHSMHMHRMVGTLRVPGQAVAPLLMGTSIQGTTQCRAVAAQHCAIGLGPCHGVVPRQRRWRASSRAGRLSAFLLPLGAQGQRGQCTACMQGTWHLLQRTVGGRQCKEQCRHMHQTVHGIAPCRQASSRCNISSSAIKALRRPPALLLHQDSRASQVGSSYRQMRHSNSSKAWRWWCRGSSSKAQDTSSSNSGLWCRQQGS